MLVKVVLSYYMEGEHSQGAKHSKGISPTDARRSKGRRVGCWDRWETGVDSASARNLCPLMPLGDGWPSLDRAVDEPALQDVPAWDGIVAWF